MAHYVCVTGGRNFDDEAAVRRVLEFMAHFYGSDLRLLHGGAQGADRLADTIADELGIKKRVYEADWGADCIDRCKPGHRRRRNDGTRYCPAVGQYRNERMADLLRTWSHQGHTVQVIAFRGGAGTAHMIEYSESLGINVDRQWVD